MHRYKDSAVVQDAPKVVTLNGEEENQTSAKTNAVFVQ